VGCGEQLGARGHIRGAYLRSEGRRHRHRPCRRSGRRALYGQRRGEIRGLGDVRWQLKLTLAARSQVSPRRTPQQRQAPVAVARSLHPHSPHRTTMARSAAQSASRRRKRQMLPEFPLTKLPLEVQLLVLGQCDLPSLRRLVRVSSRLRNLFLLYPDTCLLECLQQTPEAARGYLETSWALHNTDYEKFDASDVLTRLQSSHSIADVCAHSRVVTLDEDPLRTLNDLADLYEEVETAVGPCAQGLNAAMESIFNPCARLTPIEVSSTEHLRFVGSLWILKIYYQLHLKFSHHWKEHELRLAFVASLPPWQLHRVLSLETFLARLLEERPVRQHYVVGDEILSWKTMSAKSIYFRNYLQATGWYATSFETAAVSFINASWRFRAIPAIPSTSWLLLSSEDEFTSYPPHSDEEPRLRSFGWLFVEYVMSNYLSHGTQRALFFTETGFLFWDRSRLSAWDMSDPTQFGSALDAFMCHQLREAASQSDSLWLSKVKKAKSIARWTRCPIQYTFEEWLDQAKALRSYQGKQ